MESVSKYQGVESPSCHNTYTKIFCNGPPNHWGIVVAQGGKDLADLVLCLWADFCVNGSEEGGCTCPRSEPIAA